MEAAFYVNGFTATMNGNILIANKITNGKVESSMLSGAGYLQFNSLEKSFVGKFNTDICVSKVICAGGETGVAFCPGKWDVYFGKREMPIQVSLLCAKEPQFVGWFQINQSFVDLGLIADLGLNLESPWVGVSTFKARAWTRFNYTFGADAKVSWKPVRVNRAHIYADVFAGVGVEYKTLAVDGNFTVAAVHLGGNLLFISEPFNIPEQNIKAETSISGKLSGKVTVLGCNFGFNMDVKKVV